MIQFVLPVDASFCKLVRDPLKELLDKIGLELGDEDDDEFCAYISMGATLKTSTRLAIKMTNPAANNVDRVYCLSIAKRQRIAIYKVDAANAFDFNHKPPPSEGILS
jgi:hypothetical protein